MATRYEVLGFSPEEVCELLSAKIGSDTLSTFRSEKVTGSAFLELNENDLRELATTLGESKAIQKLIKEYEPATVSYFILNTNIAVRVALIMTL